MNFSILPVLSFIAYIKKLALLIKQMRHYYSAPLLKYINITQTIQSQNSNLNRVSWLKYHNLVCVFLERVGVIVMMLWRNNYTLLIEWGCEITSIMPFFNVLYFLPYSLLYKALLDFYFLSFSWTLCFLLFFFLFTFFIQHQHLNYILKTFSAY